MIPREMAITPGVGKNYSRLVNKPNLTLLRSDMESPNVESQKTNLLQGEGLVLSFQDYPCPTFADCQATCR